MPLTDDEEYTARIAMLLHEIENNVRRLLKSEYVPHTSTLHMPDGTCFGLAVEIKLAAERLAEHYVQRQVGAHGPKQG